MANPPDPPQRPKVIPLRPHPDENVVSIIEKLLAMAKTGDIEAIVYVRIGADGERAMSWGGTASSSDFASMAHELALTLTLASLSEYGTGE